MSQNQGNRQKNARIKAGITGGQRNGDMIRMMDLVTAVTSSDYNGKWIQFVNAKFGTNIQNVTGAKHYLANQIGFDNFDAITQFDSLFYDGTSGNTNPNDSGASAITVQLVPSTNIELATKGDASGKLKIKGKSTGEAYIMLDVGDPEVGQTYIFRYNADWSRLQNDGADVFAGIGIRSTTDNLHAAGLEGDHVGATGVTYSRIYGSNLFSRGTAPTIVTVTAATEASREGSNWVRLNYLSGNTYTFFVGSSTTSAGTRDANDIAWMQYGASGASFSGYSGTVQNFGFIVYTPFSDRGNFTVDITRYEFATAGSVPDMPSPEPSGFSAVSYLMQPTSAQVTNNGQEDPPNPGFQSGTTNLAGGSVWTTNAAPAGIFAWTAHDGTTNACQATATRFLPNTGDFTIEAWVRFNDPSNVTNTFIIAEWSVTIGTSRNWDFEYRHDLNRLGFGITAPGPVVNFLGSTGNASGITSGVTYAVAVQRRGSNFDLFLDGTRIETFSGVTESVNQQTAVPATIGKSANGQAQSIDGAVGPIRICHEAIIGDVDSYNVRTTPFATS